MKGVGVQSPQHIRTFLLCVECVPKIHQQTYLLRQRKYISYLEDQGRYRQKKGSNKGKRGAFFQPQWSHNALPWKLSGVDWWQPNEYSHVFQKVGWTKRIYGWFSFLLDDGKKEKTSWVSNAPNVFFFFRKKQRQQPQEPQTNDVHLYIQYPWVGPFNKNSEIFRSFRQVLAGCWHEKWGDERPKRPCQSAGDDGVKASG